MPKENRRCVSTIGMTALFQILVNIIRNMAEGMAAYGTTASAIYVGLPDHRLSIADGHDLQTH